MTAFKGKCRNLIYINSPLSISLPLDIEKIGFANNCSSNKQQIMLCLKNVSEKEIVLRLILEKNLRCGFELKGKLQMERSNETITSALGLSNLKFKFRAEDIKASDLDVDLLMGNSEITRNGRMILFWSYADDLKSTLDILEDFLLVS